jgi:hypothetical protein
VNTLEAILVQSGFRTLEVSTVATTIEDESYARTRSFYHAVGFLDVQIDEKWYSSGDDRLLLRKPISGPTKCCDHVKANTLDHSNTTQDADHGTQR